MKKTGKRIIELNDGTKIIAEATKNWENIFTKGIQTLYFETFETHKNNKLELYHEWKTKTLGILTAWTIKKSDINSISKI